METTNQFEYANDQTASIQLIVDSFLDAMRVGLQGSQPDHDPEPILAAIQLRHSELTDELAPLVGTDADAANLCFTLLPVAAADILEPLLGGASLPLIEHCLNDPCRAQLQSGVRAMLDAAPDPFAALVAASKQREADDFGPSFEFERRLDDEFSYVLDVPGCLFHRILTAVGRPELQAMVCRFDLLWIGAIDPVRHRLRFERPVTFATGGTCRMLFTRTAPA